MSDMNRQWTLAGRPSGFPEESNFSLVESAVPDPGDGEFVVKVEAWSVDPYMRGRMNAEQSYSAPVELGAVMEGGTVGRVVASKHPDYAEGDTVYGKFGWQEYGLSDGTGNYKVDPEFAPMSAYLGVLGMPGLTAYFGFLEICKPKEGDTVFVSGAAGAVGALVGQLAKIHGCRVVGSAGTDEKCAYLESECGYDAAFNYKTDTDFVAKLKELCPNGIDCYFDNVGGAITDAVLMSINDFARISICGQISQYNLEKPDMGPRLVWALLVHQSKMEGFLVFRWLERYAEGIKQMGEWIKEGKIKYREDIIDGFENMPKAFIRMLHGENKGKQSVRA